LLDTEHPWLKADDTRTTRGSSGAAEEEACQKRDDEGAGGALSSGTRPETLIGRDEDRGGLWPFVGDDDKARPPFDSSGRPNSND